MRKLLVLLVVGLAFSAAASAAPLCVNSMTMENLLATGCEIGDKLFSGFSYVTSGPGSTPASSVGINVINSTLPSLDIHGFTFAPLTGVWTVGFTLGYTISVIQPSLMEIVGAQDQFMLGPDPNGSVAVSTKGNGVIFTLTQGGATQYTLFSGVTSLTSSTVVTIPDGAFVASLEEDYTQKATPEPMTFVLIGTGLVGLGLVRRRTRKS